LFDSLDFCLDKKPWSKPDKDDSHEEQPDSHEEKGGSGKRPPQPYEGGKGQPPQKADGNNNDNDGKPFFVILSDKNRSKERSTLNLIC
jgi:hypothetical protein